MKKDQTGRRPEGRFGHSLPSKVVSCVASAALATMMVPAVALADDDAANADSGNACTDTDNQKNFGYTDGGNGQSYTWTCTEHGDQSSNDVTALSKTALGAFYTELTKDSDGKDKTPTELEETRKTLIEQKKTSGLLNDDLATRLENAVDVYSQSELESGVATSAADKAPIAKYDGSSKEMTVSAADNGSTELGPYYSYNTAWKLPAKNNVSLEPWSAYKSGNADIESVRIANNIKQIGGYSFYLSGDALYTKRPAKKFTVHLPDSLEKLDTSALMSIDSATNTVSYPENLSQIGGRQYTGVQTLYVLSENATFENSNATFSMANESKGGETVYVKDNSATATNADKATTDFNATHANTPENVVKVDDLGACGADEGYTSELVWTYDNGVLTIDTASNGNGKMADYNSFDDAPWSSYASNITKLEIKSGVTQVGKNAFTGLGNLTEIVMPSTLGTGTGQNATITDDGSNPFDNDAFSKQDLTLNVSAGTAAYEFAKAHGYQGAASNDELGRPTLKAQTNERFREYAFTATGYDDQGRSNACDVECALSDSGTLHFYKGKKDGVESTVIPQRHNDNSGNGSKEACPWFKEYWVKWKGLSEDAAKAKVEGIKKVVFHDGITNVGGYLFYTAFNNGLDLTGGIHYADSVTEVGGAGAYRGTHNSIVPANMNKVGFWFTGSDNTEAYVLGKDTELPTNTANKDYRNLSYRAEGLTIHLVKGGAAEASAKKEHTGKYEIVTHTAMGACGPIESGDTTSYSDAGWMWDEDSATLTIFGSGKMRDYTSFNDTPWKDYNPKSIIVKGVSSIGKHAFDGFDSAPELVYIDSSVTAIDDSSFALGSMTATK